MADHPAGAAGAAPAGDLGPVGGRRRPALRVPFPGGAALTVDGEAWVLLEEQPRRGLGGALAWASRQGAGSLHLVAEQGTGLLARRAAEFSLPTTVWHADGRTLLPAVPEPLPAVRPVDADEAALLDLIVDGGADPVVEHGVLAGEVEGLEVCRVVTDPVTGQPRIISYQPESEVSISFRQDLTDWRFAWGVEAFKQGEIQAYRFNEIDTSEEGPWIDVFVETTALPNNMKLRLWAANAFDGTVNRDRRFFAPDRTGPNVSRDLRERTFGSAPWFIVEGNDKKRARLNCIDHLLKQLPYTEVPHEEIELPERVFNPEYERQVLPQELYVPRKF